MPRVLRAPTRAQLADMNRVGSAGACLSLHPGLSWWGCWVGKLQSPGGFCQIPQLTPPLWISLEAGLKDTLSWRTQRRWILSEAAQVILSEGSRPRSEGAGSRVNWGACQISLGSSCLVFTGVSGWAHGHQPCAGAMGHRRVNDLKQKWAQGSLGRALPRGAAHGLAQRGQWSGIEPQAGLCSRALLPDSWPPLLCLGTGLSASTSASLCSCGQPSGGKGFVVPSGVPTAGHGLRWDVPPAPSLHPEAALVLSALQPRSSGCPSPASCSSPGSARPRPATPLSSRSPCVLRQGSGPGPGHWPPCAPPCPSA